MLFLAQGVRALWWRSCSNAWFFDMLLNPWEMGVWAATETVLWDFLCQQRIDEEEVYRRHCEVVEEGWFSD